jgi:hypothetical protein
MSGPRYVVNRLQANRSLVGLTALPTVSLVVARTVVGEAHDTAVTASHLMLRLQVSEARAVHPPSEGLSTVTTPLYKEKVVTVARCERRWSRTSWFLLA